MFGGLLTNGARRVALPTEGLSTQQRIFHQMFLDLLNVAKWGAGRGVLPMRGAGIKCLFQSSKEINRLGDLDVDGRKEWLYRFLSFSWPIF
jgi:hypothetical protein